MKIFLSILFSVIFSSQLFAQGFEGEIIYQGHDSTGKKTGMTLIAKGNRQKVMITSDTMEVELYIGPDSLAMTIAGIHSGVILHKDSAKAYFRLLSKEGPDSLISTTPSTKTKTISGFHCRLIEAKMSSGKGIEFWFTSEVDSDVCYSFAHSKWNELSQSGTADFIRSQNLAGKALISWRNFGKEGNPIGEFTIAKIGKRPVTDDEVNVAEEIFLMPMSPETLVRAAQHRAKYGK